MRLLTCAVFGIAIASASLAAAAQTRPFALDDFMQLEEFAAAAASPDGRWMLYEQLRPYGDIGDYSFGLYAYGKSGHRIWRYDMKKGGAPAPLPGLDDQPHSYLQGFSPSGRYLAVMQYSSGRLSLSAYDLQREKARRFGPTPALSRAGEHNPLWISDSEVVFAALPGNEEPLTSGIRAHTGKMLTRAWQDAWRGDAATASEVRTIAKETASEHGDGRLVRANARTGKVETIAEGLYADLRISPDGRLLAGLAVLKSRAAQPDQLVQEDSRRYRLTVFDLGAGAARTIAPELEFFPYSIQWAQDAQRLAAFGWREGEGPRAGRFYMIDVGTGAAQPYDHVGLDLVSERERGWRQRPERAVILGDGLAVFARPVDHADGHAPRFTYRDVGQQGLARPDWYALSSDGTSRNLTSGLPDVSPVPVHAGGAALTVAAADGVYRLYTDGERRRLTPDLPGRFSFLSPGTFATRSSVIRPDFAGEALFSVTGDGPAKIVMIDLREGREGESLAFHAPSAGAAPLAGSLAAGSVMFRADEGPASRLLVATTEAEAPPQEIARINAHLNDIDFGIWKTVSYEVEDPSGKSSPRTVESCVLLPPGFDPKTPPPLIVNVYPGIRPACDKQDGRLTGFPNPVSENLWAGKGFAYARMATPGELIRTGDGPVAGIDELLAAGIGAIGAEGFADTERVALLGFSQGGVSALYAAAHLTDIGAVIALNSWANLFSHYFGSNGVASYTYGEGFGSYITYDSIEGSDFGMGRSPFDDPQFYIHNSPVFLAPEIQAPVMLIHSDMDAFHLSQFDEMFGALKRAGKDARYVRYWGEGHGPSSPANIRDMWKRMDDFLEEAGVAPAGH